MFLFLLNPSEIIYAGNESEDSTQNYVKELWTLADNIYMSNTEEALKLSKKAYQISKDNNFMEGMSKSLGIQANAYGFIGKYDLALNSLLEKVKLEEILGNNRNMASALISIGLNYIDQKEFQDGLLYLKQAELIIDKKNIKELKPTIQINLGDLYFKLKDYKLSKQMFEKVLVGKDVKNYSTFIAKAKLGLANIYLENKALDSARIYYQSAINGLLRTDEKENLFEAYLGIANLQLLRNNIDSSIIYAKKSYQLAKDYNSLKFCEKSTLMISDLFAIKNNGDSAYHYLKLHNSINDEIFSLENVRRLKTISMDEKIRQQNLEEERINKQKRWRQQLQLVFITIFIPTLFAISLFLSRKKVKIVVIRLLGVVSLMFAFEFLTLLLHPIVAEITHHNPILEILIFVLLGFVLVPGHHKVEKFFLQRLLKHKIDPTDNIFENDNNEKSQPKNSE